VRTKLIVDPKMKVQVLLIV